MHGGREGEDREQQLRRRRRHMWPVPTPGTATTEAVPTTPVEALHCADSLQPAPDSFLKDGRRIQVGDCALFQAGNAPPFIGIIRWFTTSRDDYLKLCVNWLYRPADVKLAKGILLEAAPNEVFYSFHKDVISAASLLHPCRVAFLRKGVELPSGISSFVCRRVYDIEHRCLWWLTDQDYINERQEEVDKLLDKSRLEMHAAVQSGGRSPKQSNGPASTQQLKPGSDSVPNSGTSFPSQVKGKKRDRVDQGTEPIKRERSTKTEDVDSVSLRLDNMVKAEISKIAEKGGLTNIEGVERLVHLMQVDRAERKIDLAGRLLLADVIAATDRLDCLCRFVQLKGVAVLDDWLQEAHKGKAGDGSSPKESDKTVEEFLLALLHALDKLPVNLNALQTCNIGKSVNHLRSHKNLEIQKKARSLVDTWKKRVDAEIKMNEAKIVGSSQVVSWPGKPNFSEVPHAGNRRAGFTDTAMKNLTQPSACRALSGKTGHTDAIVKSTPVIPGSLKLPSSLPASVAISSKDLLSKAAGGSGTSELPEAMVREEKSSSSSQSQNNSQSCSSDHAKMFSSSWKEDARSSTAGSMNASKTSGGSSRHRRPSNGFHGTSISGAQKETNVGKSGPLNRTTTLDKVSQGGLMCERTHDLPVSDRGNSHRLIVRLPNPGRNPVQSAGGGSFEDLTNIGGRASSPSAPDKPDTSDRRLKLRGDACRSHVATDASIDSWQSNDVKEGLVGSDEGGILPAAIPDEERSRTADEADKATGVSIGDRSSPVDEKEGLLTETTTRNSFCSMNALIESCAKYSESSAPLSAGDDIGMNLLASVAAGEMSKSELVSLTESPGSSPSVEDHPCNGNNEAKSRLSCDEAIAQSHGQSDENADVHSEKHGKNAGSVLARDEMQEVGNGFSGDKKTVMPLRENELTREQTGRHPVSMDSHKTADSSVNSEGQTDKKEEFECNGAFQPQDKRKTSGQATDSLTDCKPKVRSPSVDEDNSVGCAREKIADGGTVCSSNVICDSLGDGCDNDSSAFGRQSEKLVVNESPKCPPFDNEVPCVATSTEQQPTPVTENHVDDVGKRVNVAGADKVHLEQADGERKDLISVAPSSIDEQDGSTFASLATPGGVEISERKEALENYPAGSASRESSATLESQEADKCTKSTDSKLSGADADARDEHDASSAEASSPFVASEPGNAAKLDFDLNEGISGDDGNQSEPATSAAPGCPSAIHLPSLSFASNGSPALITVAAPAKGPFVHPENLLKSKAEAGWKGSAATSAFRPAEPRKVPDMPPLTTTAVLSSNTAAGKHGRAPLDIDLNVADEMVLEDMASQSSAQTTGSESGVVSTSDAPVRSAGGLDLDLNRVDEASENGQLFPSTDRRLDAPLFPVRPTPGRYPSGETNMFRDFDLNNGPCLDEAGVVESLPRIQHAKSNPSVPPFLPPLAGHRMNSAEFGNLSAWFPPGNSYPAVAIPSFLPDRREQPYPMSAAAGAQRILGSITGPGTFSGEVYRGPPVLSSSAAMAYSPATAFPYGGFPFGSSFPVPSTSFSGMSTTYVDSSSVGGTLFPAIPQQLVGSALYPRPYMLSLPEGSASGGSESSRKWGRQGLDLNAGPGGADAEVKEDRMSTASRQVSVASSQPFAEEQARMYQVAGGGLKRKEPEGGWDAERFAYKQHSWQQGDKQRHTFHQ